MVLHVTPSSYRVYLSPCEVWVLERPLKLEDGCHKSARGLSDVHAAGSFCAMLWVQSAMVDSSRHHVLCL